MSNPYRTLAEQGWQSLADLGWRKLKYHRHGDLPRWQQVVDELPVCAEYRLLDRHAPLLGRPVADLQSLRQQLLNLHPWRKGPLELGGVRIDTEWRSDWKWQRIAPHLDLRGHRVLDIGCGNGYFGLRMLGAGAELVAGIDPTLVFVMQWLAMQKLSPGLKNFVLPLGIEELPAELDSFDSVFSMGVLYHRHLPVEHLKQLRKLMLPGGQLVLETLILRGSDERVLEPDGRYARMRNVHSIPTLAVLQKWLLQAGLPNSRVLDISKTTIDEQRSTDWMTFDSLRESLERDDPSLTVEGYPAPVRASLLVRV